MVFDTEFLSCLRSIHRSSSMSVSSPKSMPKYRLMFQPQPRARGSVVDATRNFLGAGMGLGIKPSYLFLSNTLLPQWSSPEV